MSVVVLVLAQLAHHHEKFSFSCLSQKELTKAEKSQVSVQVVER